MPDNTTKRRHPRRYPGLVLRSSGACGRMDVTWYVRVMTNVMAHTY